MDREEVCAYCGHNRGHHPYKNSPGLLGGCRALTWSSTAGRYVMCGCRYFIGSGTVEFDSAIDLTLELS